jgi:hypothetical protein
MHPLAPHFTPVLVKTQREKPKPIEASSKPLRVQSASAPLASALQKEISPEERKSATATPFLTLERAFSDAGIPSGEDCSA